MAVNNEELPFVSIIIPVLNEEKYITECLNNVCQQDYPTEKMEILVFDGGSTDNTVGEIKNNFEDKAQIRVLDNPGRTQVKAFNLGVKLSHGSIIIRLDAHAKYEKNYVSKCVETLAKTGAANAGGCCITKPGGNSVMAKAISFVCQERFGIGGARFRVGGQEGPVDTVPFGAFPRETFEKVGLMNDALDRGEDNEFNSRICSAGLTVYFNPEIICTYFARPTFSSFMKQLFSNGLYHILTLKVNRQGCSLRHFIPFFFVMVLLICGVLGLISSLFWQLGGLVLGLYLIVDLLASLNAALKYGILYLFIFPWLFLSVHLMYGIGTLCGIFKFLI